MSVEKHPEHSIIDAMSTEELEDILRMDSYGAADDKYHADTILSIMAMVARRKRTSAADQKTEATRALKEFKEVYLPAGEGTSLYQFEEEADEVLPATSGAIRKRGRRKPHYFLRKLGLVAAIVVAMFCIMLTAQAAGMDIWGTIARWTNETFGFHVADDAKWTEWVQKNQSDLNDVGFDESYLPDWIPEGFEPGEMQFFTCDLYSNLYFPLDHPEGQVIDITFTEYTDPSAMEDVKYEKDDTPVEEIVDGDRQIYIIENLGSVNVICQKENTICSITGSEGVSKDILLRVLNSIEVIQ